MRTQRVKYVGWIRNYGDEGDFFENVLGTMTYDICGFVHVEGLAVKNACAGCGECMYYHTYNLYKLAQGDENDPPPGEGGLDELSMVVEEVCA